MENMVNHDLFEEVTSMISGGSHHRAEVIAFILDQYNLIMYDAILLHPKEWAAEEMSELKELDSLAHKYEFCVASRCSMSFRDYYWNSIIRLVRNH